MRRQRIGVDTGGTFTDFVQFDAEGRLRIHKQASTPEDPSQAIVTGLGALGGAVQAALIHGTTVATNALLERRGTRTALITTAGFEDVLVIGRQDRPELYALVPQKPPPLVPAELRFGVSERLAADGSVIRPLDAAEVTAIVERLVEEQVEAVAVCLLFSFLNPTHERQIETALRQSGLDGLHLSLSCDILPEYREFERSATTVINAYVAPKMSRYLKRLEEGVAPRPVEVMQSSGGLIRPQTAASEAARTVLSGPAGGVVGAHYVAQQAGFGEIITFDMGGTSTDVALCPGRVPISADTTIAGLPLRLPATDIHTVGAGGGSLARVDAGGALHVGPESAGADPGPACYPRWVAPTIPLTATTTDANLVLGRLDAGHFLGGAVRLDEGAAQAALARLATSMGADTAQHAAWDVVRVANANMERAVRKISVERGHDPRRFVLVPFGGAGPLHACELAEALQISRVLVPLTPGVLSALGMLVADPQRDYARTMRRRLPASGGDPADIARWLEEQFAPLETQARDDMTADGHPDDALLLERTLDMRYLGQSHELRVTGWGNDPAAAFHATHEQRYSYRREAEVEIVTLRVRVRHVRPRPTLPRFEPAQAPVAQARLGRKQVRFAAGVVAADLYVRDRLQPDHEFPGPAVVFQYDTTTVVPPGWRVHVDAYRNLVIEASTAT